MARVVPHVFTFLSRTTTQRRAQPGGTAPCLGASLQRCVPGMQHPRSSPSTQAGSEQGLGFSHFPVAQSRVGLGRASCQAPCCLHQEERPWLGCEQQAQGGFVGRLSWRWPLPWDRRVCVGFCSILHPQLRVGI